MQRIIPEPLQKGDCAALIAPASPPSREALLNAVKSLKYLGLEPVIMPSCTAEPVRTYLASTDVKRAADLTDALADPNIKGIFCIRGGYGSMRMLQFIDFNDFLMHPKIILGSSDITCLLNAVHRHTGLVTFHAPMPSADYTACDETTLQSLNSALFDTVKYINTFSKIYLPGIQSGHRITGGNLSILCSMTGTPYEPDFSDSIVLLEDINEPLYKIDRMLTSLVSSGRLSKAYGVVFGSFTDCCRSSDDTALLHEIQHETAKRAGLQAVICDYPSGHSFPSLTIPIG
jgi:muramoyltetrapeptide carboxypeptidase